MGFDAARVTLSGAKGLARQILYSVQDDLDGSDPRFRGDDS